MPSHVANGKPYIKVDCRLSKSLFFLLDTSPESSADHSSSNILLRGKLLEKSVGSPQGSHAALIVADFQLP